MLEKDEVCADAVVVVFPAVAAGFVAGAADGSLMPRRFAAAAAVRLTVPESWFEAAVLKAVMRSVAEFANRSLTSWLAVRSAGDQLGVENQLPLDPIDDTMTRLDAPDSPRSKCPGNHP